MLISLLLAAAQAITLTVPTDEYPTLTEAALAAQSGDTIELDVQGGYTREDGVLLLFEDVTQRGLNDRATLPRLDILFADITLENVTLQASENPLEPTEFNIPLSIAYGALTLDDVELWGTDLGGTGVIALESVVQISNLAAFGQINGAAILATGGTLTVLDSTFTDNSAGGIVGVQVDLTVENTVFSGGYNAQNGSDIQVVNSLIEPVVIRNSVFDFGTALLGGAVSTILADLTITDSTFIDAWGFAGGGSVLAMGTADEIVKVEIQTTDFERSGAFFGDGGALGLYSVSASISGCNFTNNWGGNGGAIAFAGGDLLIQDSTFSSNWALDDGGSILVTHPASLYGTPDGLLTIERTDLAGLENYDDAVTGGCVSLGDGAVAEIRSSTLQYCNAIDSGGAISHRGSSLWLDGNTLKHNEAAWGGALESEGGLTATFNQFSENHAAYGAAIYTDHTAVTLADNVVTGNTATTSGAVHLDGLTGLDVMRNLFCQNSTPGGAALQLIGASGPPYAVHNNVFLFNHSDLDGALSFELSESAVNSGPLVAIHNNDLVLNPSASGARLSAGQVDFRNNIVAGQPVGLQLDDAVASVDGGYNLWFDNEVDVRGGQDALPGPTAVMDDPRFHRLAQDDCTSSLLLQPGSPARDAGDPALMDIDGSRSDIGAFGGEDAVLSDVDGDGWYADQDCDDEDAAVNPGTAEIPWDGVDNDCLDGDACDVDGDGVLHPACGGRDCDDEDPTVHPGATDAMDEQDRNCDGFTPRSWVKGGAACDHTGTAGATWLLVLGAIAARRRRPSGVRRVLDL